MLSAGGWERRCWAGWREWRFDGLESWVGFCYAFDRGYDHCEEVVAREEVLLGQRLRQHDAGTRDAPLLAYVIV